MKSATPQLFCAAISPAVSPAKSLTSMADSIPRRWARSNKKPAWSPMRVLPSSLRSGALFEFLAVYFDVGALAQAGKVGDVLFLSNHLRQLLCQSLALLGIVVSNILEFGHAIDHETAL